MTTQTEALDMITKLRLAHQAMEAACERIDQLKAENKALKEALTESKQEPVPNLYVKDINGNFHPYKEKGHTENCAALADNCPDHLPPSLVGVGENDYTAQRTAAVGEDTRRAWVGLTDEDIDEWTPEIHAVIRAIEAKLKEKNT